MKISTSLRSTLLLTTATVLITACGDRDSRYDSLSDSTPYVTDAKYSNSLKECATAETAIGSCDLNKMPTLGMEYSSPTISNVMERVLVSNAWMGERFERLLEELPADILQLLGAVTVIVIDGDIRPSYYHNVTGAIYLDPANLWMTQDEKNDIDRKPDHREAYADPMIFRSNWRYTKDSQYAFRWYGFESTEDRPFEDIIVPMASLLYHELAHANDILPVSSYNTINRKDSIYSVTESLYASYPSTKLTNTYKLTSKDMYHMAGILFQGTTPSQADTKITATQMGAFFAPDSANDDYAYSSQYEDLAMLVEEAMMKFHFNIDRDVAYIEYPGDNLPSESYVVAWGQRNRIGEERIKQRAQFVFEQILPNEDYSESFASLPATTQLRNVDWNSSLSLEKNTSQKLGIQSQNNETKSYGFESTPRLYGVHR